MNKLRVLNIILLAFCFSLNSSGYVLSRDNPSFRFERLGLINPEDVKPRYGPATDLTTRTIFCGCPEENASDTLVSINGSKVCVTDAKTSGSKLIKATLVADVNIQVGDQVFPLKALNGIEFEPGNSGLKNATLRANTFYKHKVGELELAGNKLINFHENMVMSAFISKPCEVNFLGENLTIIPSGSRYHDISFDFTNELSEFTIGKALTIVENPQFNFPEKSSFFCSGGKIEKVVCTEESSFTIGEQTFKVGADSKANSYKFNKDGGIEEIMAGEGNLIKIEGQEILIKPGTSIRFENTDGVLYIERFIAASESTINVYKKNKVQQVTLKSGDKVILEKGVVVKAG